MNAFASLGVGGVLAGLVFYFYRKDSLEREEQWKDQVTILVQVVKENTAAISVLISEVHNKDKENK